MAVQSGITFGGGEVVSIGECMVELTRGGDGRYGLAYGGDSFNTAVYMARCGVPVAYATLLADDPYSAGIRALAEAEGVSTALMGTLPGRMPGLYLIETNAAGERTFWYWRERAAARELFDTPAAVDQVGEVTRRAAVVYFSGVTLSLYSASGLDAMAALVGEAKAAGARIAMDSNYRPRGWAGDPERARAVFGRFWSLADIALPTFDDEVALWGDASAAATVARLSKLGVAEIVVKLGEEGALVSAGGVSREVACPHAVAPVDTTAAGDSFNAGYLARRRAGQSPADAALFAHRLAGIVIQHRGAIVPRAATQVVTG